MELIFKLDNFFLYFQTNFIKRNLKIIKFGLNEEKNLKKNKKNSKAKELKKQTKTITSNWASQYISDPNFYFYLCFQKYLVTSLLSL